MFNKLKLVTEHNDPTDVLHTVCTEVEDPKSKVKQLKQMVKIMREHGGVGLSANQVGLTDRMFVYTNKQGVVEFVINPEIIKAEKKMATQKEACLSYPKRGQVNVKRYVKIKVRYHNGYAEVVKNLKGLEARVFAHELDHLNGCCIVSKEG